MKFFHFFLRNNEETTTCSHATPKIQVFKVSLKIYPLAYAGCTMTFLVNIYSCNLCARNCRIFMALCCCTVQHFLSLTGAEMLSFI